MKPVNMFFSHPVKYIVLRIVQVSATGGHIQQRFAASERVDHRHQFGCREPQLSQNHQVMMPLLAGARVQARFHVQQGGVQQGGVTIAHRLNLKPLT